MIELKKERIRMKPEFIDFWHMYAPQKQYHNRYLACRRLWDTMDDARCEAIVAELERKRRTESVPTANEKNPYFYLIDWHPSQPQWLSPKEVGYLLAQHVALAVCRNPQSNSFGTVTRVEAEKHGLEVHHYM